MISFKRMTNNNHYILEFNDGHIVAKDIESGGYPYRAYSPANIYYWDSEEKAISYAQMFRDKINQIPIQVFGLFELEDK